MKRYITNIATLAFIAFGGICMQAEEIRISNALDFEILARKGAEGYDFAGDVILLEADIDVVSDRIPNFAGHFNGKGHTITHSSGLVDTLSSTGFIENLTLKGLSISGKNELGSFANVSAGKILNCINRKSISVSSGMSYCMAGGIAGKTLPGSLTGLCINEASIRVNVTDMERVYFPRVGGIVGWALGDVEGCVNKASVTVFSYGTALVGGIVGHFENGKAWISGCVNEGEISSTLDASELTSTMIHQTTGGIVGRVQRAKYILDCRNYAVVGNNMGYLGGICGESYGADIINCANYGKVYSTKKFFDITAAGICAEFDSDDTSRILNCLNTGTISARTSNSFTATSAGICGVAQGVDAANNLNTGSLETSGRYEFKDNTLKPMSGKISFEPKDRDEANGYVDRYNAENKLPSLRHFQADTSGMLLETSSLYAIAREVGELRFYFLPEDIASVNVKLDSPGSLNNDSENYRGFSNLTPDKYYGYDIISNGKSFRNESSTLPPDFRFDVNELEFNRISGICNVSVTGLSNPSLSLKLGDGITGEWTPQILNEDSSFGIKDLKEMCAYHLVAVLSWDGGSMESSPYRFSTPELFPKYEVSEVGPNYMVLECVNYPDMDVLKGDDYGVFFRNNSSVSNKAVKVYCTDSRIAVINNMAPTAEIANGYYTFEIFTERNGELHKKDMQGKYYLAENTLIKPVHISPTGLRFIASLTSNAGSGHIQIRKSATQEEISVEEINPVVNDLSYYVIVRNPGLGDYSARSQSVSVLGKKSYSAWIDFSIESADCVTIPPEFFNEKVYSLSASVSKVSTSFADGEGQWQYGFKWRKLGEDEWNDMGLEAGKHVITMNNPATGDDIYEGYFYGMQGDVVATSVKMRFDSEKLLGRFTDMESVEFRQPDQSFSDAPDDYIVYDFQGRIVTTLKSFRWGYDTFSGKQIKGFYIIVNSRGVPKKVLIE